MQAFFVPLTSVINQIQSTDIAPKIAIYIQHQAP
jgi:hypothetical protein